MTIFQYKELCDIHGQEKVARMFPRSVRELAQRCPDLVYVARERMHGLTSKTEERMKKTCANCQYWAEESYCEMKDLYTLTEPDRLCDEEDIWGAPYFLPNKRED